MRTRFLFGLAAALVASVAIGAGDEAARSKQAEAPPGERVACGAGGTDVTVALDYNRDAIGMVAAMYVDVGFREPLAFPRPAAAEKLRGRLTSLLASEYHVALVKQESAGKVRVALTTTEPGIPVANAFKLHFDCAAGSQVRSTDLTCSTGEVVDGAGSPMAETLARQVRCRVTQLDPVRSE